MAQKDEERKPYVYTPHTYDPFVKSDNLTSAEGKASTANDAYTNWVNNGFNFSQADAHKAATDQYNAWLNNGFSYDFNQDALYQQYKDKYIKQGKMAMQDTMGQAAAITGGYGNSYAATVGNQAYQASLENLNDVIPELYQMAYNMHQDKGQNYLNQIGLYDKERAYEYGLWSDKANRLDSDRAYAQSVADSLYNREYGAWNDNRTYSQTEHHNSENMRYQDIRDAIADAQFDRQMQHQTARDAVADAQFDRQMQLEENKFKYTTGEYQPVDGNGTPIVNNSGGNDGGNLPTGGITDAMREKAATFTDNKSLEAYAESLEASTAISHEEALQLVADYYDHNEVYHKDASGKETNRANYTDMIKSTKGWKMAYKGGGNLWGIDANARVITPNGEEIRLDKLRDRITDEGIMNKKQADDYIKQLQQALGISSNWFFGL